MPHNTRPEFLSLPSPGIHLPVTCASKAASLLLPPSIESRSENPQSKIFKRSFEDSPSMSPPPKRAALSVKYKNTPPSSPEAETTWLEDEDKQREIDLDGINDEIVEGVIIQLQTTGNRPHLAKELAAVLSQSVKIVEHSANPSAIISSRLSTYLKRTWTALAPCPIAKKQETADPRRTYFYLTTCPHQSMPGPATMQHVQRVITSPSTSSAAPRSDEADAERRRELSPSPELDLSSPELENDGMESPPTPSQSFVSRLDSEQHYVRALSPPLEKDEKEFTQTVCGMQRRQKSRDVNMSGVLSGIGDYRLNVMESGFGEGHSLTAAQQNAYSSSPAMKASLLVNSMKRGLEDGNDMWAQVKSIVEWDIGSPEFIELDELDELFDDF